MTATAPTAVDLFAGAGGATQGLRDAGFNVVGAVEFDPEASRSYRLNHPRTRLWQSDIRSLPAERMRIELGLRIRELTLLKACPPCQGFSSLAGGRSMDETRNDLVHQVVRFTRAFMPKAILLENVPGLARDRRFTELTEKLSKLGYSFGSYKLNATVFGVPQRRNRLVVLGIRSRKAVISSDIWEILGQGYAPVALTAGEALQNLYSLARKNDPLNRHRSLSKSTAERVKAIPVGGTRFDLPPEHRLRCHNEVDSKGGHRATASYGRVKLDLPAPTMTTRCTTPACGSFIHPIENRGLTLREAAYFQTFPVTYDFLGSYESIERQIGNAVPVEMAKYLGIAVLKSVRRARLL
ncbi:DNA (cytosine-5)-methyltransferase 1 [Saccharothrix saharensis]|uniref:DNA (cytosine-5-)-methyltransferase n=1 Tax=Saccharothrix saharensis TaxID=571190 RepID=A0A543JHE5_9PSEU|nr:DNA cytosine methyltransferase [Saccharothrix saharensis]TQM82268.1 DNA (cytosine-5)-methyltransferase 1 [Saccharothrix saharensis]